MILHRKVDELSKLDKKLAKNRNNIRYLCSFALPSGINLLMRVNNCYLPSKRSPSFYNTHKFHESAICTAFLLEPEQRKTSFGVGEQLHKG